MYELDEFQAQLARSIEQAKPAFYEVSELIVFYRYRPKSKSIFNAVPYEKMKEIAANLGCCVSVSVWTYNYFFWWGEWVEHPYIALPDKDVCGLQTPNGFTCYLPSGCHHARA